MPTRGGAVFSSGAMLKRRGAQLEASPELKRILEPENGMQGKHITAETAQVCLGSGRSDIWPKHLPRSTENLHGGDRFQTLATRFVSPKRGNKLRANRC